LEESVVPCFYREPESFREIMRHAIAHNAAFFNAERMLSQYLS
jgi:starch phosphorylase